MSLQIEMNDPKIVADHVPAYPYGPARWYKQSNRGLYAGQRIQFGHNVSGKFNAKTNRTFKINVFTKRLWSVALGRAVQVRVSATALRTIEKSGGLDEYLLGDTVGRIKELGVSGWWLRWAIMQTDHVKARFRDERARLGLPQRMEPLDAGTKIALGDVDPPRGAPDGRTSTRAGMASKSTSSAASPENKGFRKGATHAGEMTSPGSFAVDHTSDLPAFKFRVGKGKHVRLTSSGWVRTRPDPAIKAKKQFQTRLLDITRVAVAQRLDEFKATLGRQKTEGLNLTKREEAEVLHAAGRRISILVGREIKARAQALKRSSGSS